MIRLGLHCHIVAKEVDEKIYMIGHFGRFIDSLAACCDYLYIFLHEADKNEKAITDYCLTANNVKWVNIGPHSSVPKRVINSYKVKRIIRQWRGKLDCMLIRGPSPLLPQVAQACGSLPIALLFGGDPLAGINDLPQPFWRKELIRVFWKWNYQQQSLVTKSSLTFVNSELLYRQFQGKAPNLVKTRTTTLLQNEFYYREDTCQKCPIHLLYTGRMDRAKGLMDILQALIALVREGDDVVLDLVGMAEKGDPILMELNAEAARAGMAERVSYHGYHSVGPDLFQFYRQADIFVLASRASEGFPRTIWEAMAHSLPVVATRVGSIPDFIEGAAVLVAPKDEPALENAIRTLLRDSELRKRNIAAGLQLARKVTLEAQVPQMVETIEGWVRDSRAGESSKPLHRGADA